MTINRHTRTFILAPICTSFALAGCAEPPKPHPVRDYPVSATLLKDTKSLGTTWENEFGLVQGTRAGGMVFLSGQIGVDEQGALLGKGSMEAQLRQAYRNVIKVLKEFGLTLNDVLEETIFCTDMQAVLNVGPRVRREMYSEHPAVASTLIQVQRLALADALVEIRIVAKTAQIESIRPLSTPSDDSPRRGTRGSGRGRSSGFGGSSPY